MLLLRLCECLNQCKLVFSVIKLFFIRCSNRAAAFLSLVKLSKALADAETTIRLNPQWEKVNRNKRMGSLVSVSTQCV